MKGDTIKRAVDDAQAAFSARLDAIAEDARALMLPYFAKRRWTYKAGNGTWFIDDARGRAIEDEDLPRWIREMLWIEPERGQHLGYYIRDINR